MPEQQMQVDLNTLMAIIGDKETQIVLLRRQIALLLEENEKLRGKPKLVKGQKDA